MSNMKPYYQDQFATIYHGDCRELIADLPEFASVITDPPFSETTHANAKTNKGAGSGVKAIGFDSFGIYEMGAILSILGRKSSGWVIASMDWRHIARMESEPPLGLRLMRFGVWVKPNPMPQISCDRPAQGWEGIAYFHRDDRKPSWGGGGTHGNFWLPVAQTEDHPTEKPLSMLLSLVERFTSQGDLICDPFMGSGTTLRAAKDLRRRAIGIERDEAYCEIAARRMAQEVLAL